MPDDVVRKKGRSDEAPFNRPFWGKKGGGELVILKYRLAKGAAHKGPVRTVRMLSEGGFKEPSSSSKGDGSASFTKGEIGAPTCLHVRTEE